MREIYLPAIKCLKIRVGKVHDDAKRGPKWPFLAKEPFPACLGGYCLSVPSSNLVYWLLQSQYWPLVSMFMSVESIELYILVIELDDDTVGWVSANVKMVSEWTVIGLHR